MNKFLISEAEQGTVPLWYTWKTPNGVTFFHFVDFCQIWYVYYPYFREKNSYFIKME